MYKVRTHRKQVSGIINIKKVIVKIFVICLLANFFIPEVRSQGHIPKFKVIAFYKGINDQAHVSFVHEANKWFTTMAIRYNFAYDSTNNWDNLNEEFLSYYKLVIFLDARPDSTYQRLAFEKYMENGGAWMGFHFCAFALTPSAYPQNWNWYHNQFLGSGEYKGNTWKPTSAVLRTEDQKHPSTKHLPETFTSSPNEWYSWENDLRNKPEIKILLSIDSTSFPLGTGPKLYEIWHRGYYPVVWTNKNYKMIYINMGHNDIAYENNTNKELSFTFKNEIQNQLILDGLLWLGQDTME
jgi:uncharacterized protein